MFVDLDGFKEVNDTLGHAAGDELLRVAAQRLTDTIRDCDTVGRIGGDEFIVLFDGDINDERLAEVGERILRALRHPFELGQSPGQGVNVSASIGLATGCPSSSNELMRNADVALYRAKATGKNRVVVFDDEMGLQAETRRFLETDLQAAAENNEFFLVYQPLFDLASETVTGVEALLRWHSEQRGPVPPDLFVPILETNGLILPVGRFVLREACRQGAEWLARGYSLEMSVNISPVQLASACFVDDLRAALDASGFPATSLILEITETALMHDIDQCAVHLQAARRIGVRVAIDDFGSGYSSMAYLRQLPIDMLKIDRSFVSAMAESTEACAIVKNLVQLGRSLGLHTLAEGIEEPQQLERLLEQDCEAGQGFLLGRPAAPCDVERLLAERQPLSA
jgi:diguanylate cyclase (GGDEF)-like protein